MAMWIGTAEMTSGITAHRAERRADGWRVSWLPDRVLSHAQAVTAMTIAEAAAATVTDPATAARLRPHLCGWAAELGLSVADALALAGGAPTEHEGEL